MHIRKKLIIILLIFSIIPFLCLGLIEITKDRKILKEQIGNNSMELSRSLMRHIDEYLYSKYINIQGWTKNKCLNDVTSGDEHGNISQFLVGLAEIHDEYYYINFLNTNGQVVASNIADLKGRDLSAGVGFKEALNGNQTMQDIAFNEAAGGYAIVMSTPVWDIPEQSEIIGVLTVAIKWDMVTKMVTSLKIGGREQTLANHIMLLNKEGLVISCFDKKEIFTNNLIEAGKKSAKYAQKHKEGYLTETSEHGFFSFVTYTYSREYKDLPHLDWIMILEQDPKEVFAVIGLSKKTIIITLLGTSVLLIIISFLFANRISKPILAIVSAAKAIGKGDLNTKVPVKSKDEIGLLSNSFNEMVKALRESRQMLNLVMDNIPQSIFWKDRKSVYLGCNKNFAKVAGVGRPENIIGRTDYDLAWKKEEADFFLTCDERVISSGKAEYHIIEPQLQADGKDAWLDTNKVPLCDPEGNVIGILGTYEDITERKQAERRLNAQYAVTQVLAESTTLEEAAPRILQAICEALEWDLGEIWVYDQQQCTLRNTEIWHLPSLKFSEFKAVTMHTTFSPQIGLPGRVWESAEPLWIEDVVYDPNFLRASIADKVGLHGAFGFPIIIDSEVLGIICFFSLEIRKPDKDLLEMMTAIGRQISLFIKRKQAEQETRKSEEKYRKLMETAQDAILCDINGIITDWNKSAEELFGYSKDEIIGKSVSILVPEKYKKEHQEGLERFLKTGESRMIGKTMEVSGITKEGTEIPIEMSLTAQKIGEGQYSFMAIVRDLTERKKMEETLLQTEKLRAMGMMTSGVAHDFNNILAIISGHTQLLEGSHKEDKELTDIISTIHRAAEDGAGIVRRMSQFTKMERDITDFVSVNIKGVLEGAIGFLKPRWLNISIANGRPFDVDMDGIKEIPSILGNPTELREVFINIINNAMDAMSEGGRLSFRTWTEEDTVLVSITDTGEGMPEEVKKRIFDPFFTTKRAEGSGLGMSEVYGIVTGHGGKIDISSEVGKGTTFTLKFPIATETIQEKVLPEPGRKTATKKLRILVVDDEKDICNILNMLFSRDGHDVKAVGSGKEAIKLIKREEFDLVLSDLVMPGLSGHDVIHALDELGKRPKVGLITGWEEEVENKDKEELNVDFIIRKPFDISELRKQINDLFD